MFGKQSVREISGDASKHLKTILKINSSPLPWPHMILCGLATCAPLFVGILFDQLNIAVYGAIVGYLVALNDHFGFVKHRLWVTNLTFIFLILGFGIGLFVGDGILYWSILGALTYWLGVLAGQGAEMERGILFGVIALVVAQSTPEIPFSLFPLLLLYVGVSYLSLMIGIPGLSLISKEPTKIFQGIRDSFKKSLTKKIENHIHAASYALAALGAVALTNLYNVERGYWVTITVLLVMRPDRTQSVYITFQRLVGTLLGVLVAEAVIQNFSQPTMLIIGILISAAAVPWAAVKNYALVAFFATIMVVFLLELNFLQQIDTHLPWVRLQATLVGCGLSLLGSVASWVVDSIDKAVRNQS